jgi:hypothetical protein
MRQQMDAMTVEPKGTLFRNVHMDIVSAVAYHAFGRGNYRCKTENEVNVRVWRLK